MRIKPSFLHTILTRRPFILPKYHRHSSFASIFRPCVPPPYPRWKMSSENPFRMVWIDCEVRAPILSLWSGSGTDDDGIDDGS